MKNYLLTVSAFLILICSVQAQHINLGIKGGLNGYTIQGKSNTSYDPRFSFNLGLLGHIHLRKQLALQPEIVFSGQGARYTVAGTTLHSNLNYVNIPLLFQYMFDNGFRIEGGPQIGFLASAKSVNGSTKTDVKSSFKNAEIGLAVGLSYVKPSTGFGFDIRYNQGLTDIASNNTIKAYNAGIQLGLFYLFHHRS
ncbi:MAG: porin family protein [Saprospiraceae bacterium]